MSEPQEPIELVELEEPDIFFVFKGASLTICLLDVSGYFVGHTVDSWNEPCLTLDLILGGKEVHVAHSTVEESLAFGNAWKRAREANRNA